MAPIKTEIEKTITQGTTAINTTVPADGLGIVVRTSSDFGETSSVKTIYNWKHWLQKLKLKKNLTLDYNVYNNNRQLDL